MERLLPAALLAMLLLAPCASAQAPARGPQRPDDVPAFAAPPAGFDTPRDGIARGRVETVEYESKTVGTRRKMLVYTPPGYSPDETYNVLYLLHGLRGDETDWQRFCAADVVLDNLHADGKLAPMIVVFPNGRAKPNDRAGGDVFEQRKAFDNFRGDLLDDVIPFVESRYPLKPGREHRALAGFSMGGGQSLDIGLGHLDQFAWIGGFSAARNMRPLDELVPHPAAAAGRLKLLFLSCGNRDGLIPVGRRLHEQLRQASVPHVWHVSPGGHDVEVWKRDLYHFAQLLFR